MLSRIFEDNVYFCSSKMEVIENPKDLAQAYTLFKKGKLAVAMGQYDQAIDLLRQAYNLIGEDGLISMDHQLVGELTDQEMTSEAFHELMCKAYFYSENYENAFEQAMIWQDRITNKYGAESSEMVGCYSMLAKIHAKLKLPEKEFDQKEIKSWRELIEFFRVHSQTYPMGIRNLEQPMAFYSKAYELLKKEKGAGSRETQNLKTEIIHFYLERWLTILMIRFLWLAISLVPLLMIVCLVVFGFSWRALGFFALGIVVFTLWRIIHAAVILTLTYRHYKSALK